MSPRARAVVAVFELVCELTPRTGKTYAEWLREVTDKFTRVFGVLDAAL